MEKPGTIRVFLSTSCAKLSHFLITCLRIWLLLDSPGQKGEEIPVSTSYKNKQLIRIQKQRPQVSFIQGVAAFGFNEAILKRSL
jgi:hypothetical protein